MKPSTSTLPPSRRKAERNTGTRTLANELHRLVRATQGLPEGEKPRVVRFSTEVQDLLRSLREIEKHHPYLLALLFPQ